MKRIILWTLGILMAGPAAAIVRFEADPPPAPEKAPVVKIVPTPLSHASMLKRATELGLRDARLVRGPRGLVLRSGSLLLQKDPQGTEFFADLNRYLIGDGLKPLPDEEAQRAGWAFLEKFHGEMDLKQAFVRSVRHVMSQGQDLRSGELLPAVQEQTLLHLGRKLDGIEVIGPGEGIRLHVTNAGDVVGLHRVWRMAVVSDKMIPLLPYEEVRRNLLGRLEREARQNDVVIKRIEFGFYSREEGLRQEYFVPVYLFTAEFVDPEAKVPGAARHIPIPALGPNDLPEDPEPPDHPRPEGDEKRIIFNAEPPPIAGAVPVLQVIQDQINPDLLLRRATALSMSLGSADIEENARGLVARDEKNQMLLFQDTWGTETFAKLGRLFQEPPVVRPISNAEAIKAAQTWVLQSGNVNPELLGDPAVRRIRSAGFDIQNQKGEPVEEGEVIVEFPMMIAGVQGEKIPVLGEGAFFNVFVNGEGQINGHHRVMRSFQKLDKVMETRPFSAIHSAFVRHMMSTMGRSIAEVRSIKFGLYARPEGFRQGYLLPAVQYEVALIDPDDGSVTAIRNIPVPAGDELEPLEDEAEQDMPPGEPDSRETNELPLAFGDLTGDGKVELADVVLAIQICGGLVDGSSLPTAQFAAGDVLPAGLPMGDGAIRLGDAERILRAMMGLETLN